MAAAYETSRGFFRAGDTLYIAGTDFKHRPLEDLAADLTIPFGHTYRTPRYKELRELIQKHKPKKLVGHSLGGSLALEAQREFPTIQVETYGAPVLSLTPNPNRHANWGDPIAALDLGASHTIPRSILTHRYDIA
jgi:hypothetical protein